MAIQRRKILDALFGEDGLMLYPSRWASSSDLTKTKSDTLEATSSQGLTGANQGKRIRRKPVPHGQDGHDLDGPKTGSDQTEPPDITLQVSQSSQLCSISESELNESAAEGFSDLRSEAHKLRSQLEEARKRNTRERKLHKMLSTFAYGEILDHERDRDAALERLHESKAEIARLRSAHEQQIQHIKDLYHPSIDVLMEQLEEQECQMQRQLQEHQLDIDTLQERMNTLHTNSREKDRRIDDLLSRINELNERLHDNEQHVQTLSSQLTEAQDENRRLDGIQQEVHELRPRVGDLSNQLSEKNREIRTITQQLANEQQTNRLMARKFHYAKDVAIKAVQEVLLSHHNASPSEENQPSPVTGDAILPETTTA